MILRTAQNCSHGSAFAVDGGTTNCALTRWLIRSFAVPFDMGYVAAPGFRSSAAARTKADRWQLEEQRRRQGHYELQQLITSSSHQGRQRHHTPVYSPPFCPALRQSKTATTILHHDTSVIPGDATLENRYVFLRFGW